MKKSIDVGLGSNTDPYSFMELAPGARCSVLMFRIECYTTQPPLLSADVVDYSTTNIFRHFRILSQNHPASK